MNCEKCIHEKICIFKQGGYFPPDAYFKECNHFIDTSDVIFVSKEIDQFATALVSKLAKTIARTKEKGGD